MYIHHECQQVIFVSIHVYNMHKYVCEYIYGAKERVSEAVSIYIVSVIMYFLKTETVSVYIVSVIKSFLFPYINVCVCICAHIYM